jgi:hypothetical protein
MNWTQPEADTEYSSPRGGSGRRAGAPRGARGGLRRTALALGVTGASLLAVAEFTPLLKVRTIAAHPRVVKTLQTGPHHGWAVLVIAVLAALLSLQAWRTGGRAALALLGVAGLGALAVALFVDLPDVHSTGLVGSPATGLVNAQAHAGVGLYLETLGAIVLLLCAAAGTMLGARSPSRRQPPSDAETRGSPTARDRGLR